MSDEPSYPEKTVPPDPYGFTAKEISGKEISLSSFKGKVLLIVNTASKCGHTPQYAGLENLYQKYKAKGFEVLAFPSNSFKQEPEDESQIKVFCETTYHTTFPLFSKVEVKGKDKHPLFDWLTDRTSNPDWGGKIGWNFNKFLIGRDGKVVDRFASNEEPEDETITSAIEELLEDNGKRSLKLAPSSC